MKIFGRLCECIFLSLFLLTAAQFAIAQDESKSYTGLWVGEVILSKVSMLDGTKAEEPTADTAGMRVILHVNTENETYLLSHVALAQSAGAEEERLFTDEEELSKWIKDQKDTKTEFAVRRIETVSYDLPRKELPPEPLPEDFDRKTLKEDYELAHLLDGEVVPGRTVKTQEGAFVIDQWHRSNPFRHAYHKQHTEGYPINREMQFTFDLEPLTLNEEPSDEGESPANYGVEVLTGTYSEKISGLVKEDINISGRFILYRISLVGELNQ